MAKRITELTSATVLAETDLLPVVDTSDTTQATSGTTKKSALSLIADYLKARVETLTNKTIDGDTNTISNLAHGAEVDNPTSGVHGVTGSVVGTTDTQTLTNKTLTSPKINEDVALTANSTELNLLDNQTVLRKQIIGDFSGTALLAGNTLYYACGFGGSNAYEPSYVMSIAGTVRNLKVYSAGSPGAGQSYVATMMKNNSAQTVTCTIGAGTNVSADTTHSFTVSVGDRISLQVVSSAGAASTSINYAFEFNAT